MQLRHTIIGRISVFTCIAASIAFAALVTSRAAWAEYPEKPIRLVVNFSPGDTTDIAARLIVSKASEILGQPIFITYRPGAGGALGVSEIARQRPDGYVVGTSNLPAIAFIPQMRDVPYKPFEDIIQIAAVMPYEYALLVRYDAPWQTWDEFVEYAKKNPGTLSYGTLGTGTTNHLVTARIGKELDINWRHVPFQGGVKAVAALLGGHVDIINNTMASVVSSIRAKQLRALLITSEDRFEATPDTPTMQEAGFGFSQISYMSIVGPGGLDQEIRSKIEAALKQAIEDEGVRQSLSKIYLRPRFISGVEYQAKLVAVADEWADLLQELGGDAKN